MARPFFLEPRPLMRSSWHNMPLQSQLANSQDQTKGLLSKEASKESADIAGATPASCSLEPSLLQSPTSL